jgi:hypothetical protein
MKTSKRFRKKQLANIDRVLGEDWRFWNGLHTRWSAIAICDRAKCKTDPLIVAYDMFCFDKASREKDLEKKAWYAVELYYWNQGF